MNACIEEGNGSPLQYSCLENPREVGAWWAAICGVAELDTIGNSLPGRCRELKIFQGEERNLPKLVGILVESSGKFLLRIS